MAASMYLISERALRNFRKTRPRRHASCKRVRRDVHRSLPSRMSPTSFNAAGYVFEAIRRERQRGDGARGGVAPVLRGSNLSIGACGASELTCRLPCGLERHLEGTSVSRSKLSPFLDVGGPPGFPSLPTPSPQHFPLRQATVVY